MIKKTARKSLLVWSVNEKPDQFSKGFVMPAATQTMYLNDRSSIFFSFGILCNYRLGMNLSNSFCDNTVESILIMHFVVDGSPCHGVFGDDDAQHQEEDERVEATADPDCETLAPGVKKENSDHP
jgi:hypothetical protein